MIARIVCIRASSSIATSTVRTPVFAPDFAGNDIAWYGLCGGIDENICDAYGGDCLQKGSARDELGMRPELKLTQRHRVTVTTDKRRLIIDRIRPDPICTRRAHRNLPKASRDLFYPGHCTVTINADARIHPKTCDAARW